MFVKSIACFFFFVFFFVYYDVYLVLGIRKSDDREKIVELENTLCRIRFVTCFDCEYSDG